MKNILDYKYCAYILLLILAVGCQDISGPELSERISIKSISKWKVDTANDSKIARIFFKEFDTIGNLTLLEDFSENGTILSKSVFSYTSNSLLEVKSSFSEGGQVKENSQFEYIYDNLGRVAKQINYTQNGTVELIVSFTYDSYGNVLKSTKEFGASTAEDTNINFDYTYNSTGAVVEKITKNDLGNLARESISYDSKQRKVIVDRYDSLGEFASRTVYFYNSVGNITSEFLYDTDYQIINKFVYEYEFYLN